MKEPGKSGEFIDPQGPSRFWQSDWVNTLGRFLALIVVFLFFAFMVKGGKFVSVRNLENILLQSSVYATAALGMTMVIIAAGIDLSIGSVIALTVVMVAWVLNLHVNVVPAGGGEAEVVYLIHKWPVMMPLLAVFTAVITATLAGLCNGATIVSLRLVPFIVTLGTMGIFRGLAKGLADERDIYPPESTWISDIMDPSLAKWFGWITGQGNVRPEGLDWFILPLGAMETGGCHRRDHHRRRGARPTAARADEIRIHTDLGFL